MGSGHRRTGPGRLRAFAHQTTTGAAHEGWFDRVDSDARSRRQALTPSVGTLHTSGLRLPIGDGTLAGIGHSDGRTSIGNGWPSMITVADFGVRYSSRSAWRGRASLAQSAERFHGKEKVESSILSGGSAHATRRVRDHGDVAQLVRVLDS